MWGVGGEGKANILTHTHSVPGHRGDGWNIGQGSDTILTYVGVAPPQIKSMGYDHRENVVGGGGASTSKHTQTHTHIHTHTQCPP